MENASTSAQRTVNYTYDDLNRLISADSSNVTSTSNYSYTYSYDAIGNLLSGPAGTYSYDVATSSYANPHAVASITLSGTETDYSYDNNGNLTSASQGTSTVASYTWDYRNRLTQSTSSSATSTYLYDPLNQRIELTENSTSTIFPTMIYNVTGSSTVKQVMANGILIATIEKATSTTATRYVLNDNLGGTNLVTDTSDNIGETLDYYPYGKARIDIKSSTYTGEKRKYIGQEFDEGTSLSYLNARYYDGTRGQFVSEDPVFLAIGSPQLNRLINGNLAMILSNPQALNSYSYALDNPIAKSDPTGLLTQSQQQQLQQIINQLEILVTTLQGMSGGSGSGNSSGNSGSNPSTPSISNGGGGGAGSNFGSTPSVINPGENNRNDISGTNGNVENTIGTLSQLPPTLSAK